MNTKKMFGAALSASMLAAAAGQGPFTPGNLVVSAVGDGATTLSSAAAQVAIVELQVAGTVVQTVALPTTVASTGNRALTVSGSATSDGFLTRSADGRYLVLAGYNAAPGTASVTSAAGINRVVGRIAADGTVDTTTELTDGSFSGNNVRSAASSDGNDLWAAGASGGIRYVTLGGNSSQQLSTTVANMRVVNVFSGQLYASSMSGAFRGVNAIGAGLPTTSGQITILLPGFDPATNSPESAYDFILLDANTLYVADDRSLPTGGLQKWTFNGTTWSLAYTLNAGLTASVRGLTSSTSAGVTTIYATTADAITAVSGNKVVSIVDAGALSSFTVVATAPGNTWYKGVDLAPEGVVAPPACYPNCDGSTASPCLTVADFGCFLNSFAAGASYANCDGSTTPPVLTVADFGCFLNGFAAGCSGC